MGAEVTLTTESRAWKRVFAASNAGSSFAALSQQTTEPTGDGIFDLAKHQPSLVRFQFSGVGSDDSTFQAQVWSWIPDEPYASWVPMLLWEGTITLGALAGVVGCLIPAAENIADTIVTDSGFGTEGADCQSFSPAGDFTANVMVDMKGARKGQMKIKVGSATSGNAIWAGV